MQSHRSSKAWSLSTAMELEDSQVNQPEQYDVVILGSGEPGKRLAWSLASRGKETAVVERRYIEGSCPNIACLPSKNEIYSAEVATCSIAAASLGFPRTI